MTDTLFKLKAFIRLSFLSLLSIGIWFFLIGESDHLLDIPKNLIYFKVGFHHPTTLGLLQPFITLFILWLIYLAYIIYKRKVEKVEKKLKVITLPLVLSAIVFIFAPVLTFCIIIVLTIVGGVIYTQDQDEKSFKDFWVVNFLDVQFTSFTLLAIMLAYMQSTLIK